MTAARNDDPGFGIVVLALIYLAGLVAVPSWLVMLAAGAIHHSVTANIPAISFRATIAATIVGAVAAAIVALLTRRK